MAEEKNDTGFHFEWDKPKNDKKVIGYCAYPCGYGQFDICNAIISWEPDRWHNVPDNCIVLGWAPIPAMPILSRMEVFASE